MFLLFVVSNKVCVHRKRTRECDRYIHGRRNFSWFYHFYYISSYLRYFLHNVSTSSHSFYFGFVSSDRLSKWMCQRVVTMKQLLPVWWMMYFLLYRRLSGENAQSSNPELKISEYLMAQYSESRIFMHWTVV